MYFPYRADWAGQDVIPTLTYHPLDNGKVNEGWKPIKASPQANVAFSITNTEGWQKVTVNDEYAMNNPTMIIVPCEEGPFTDPCDNDYDFPPGGGGGSGDETPPCQPGDNCAHKVQIGWAELSDDYDPLFAGGSEIFWTSVDAVYLLASQDSAQLEKVAVGYTFSRSVINDKSFMKIYANFDSNWKEFEISKPLLITEADGGYDEPLGLEIGINIGTKTYGLNFSVNVGLESITLIKTYFDRDVFFTINDTDIGNGRITPGGVWATPGEEGVAVRSAGHLRWTMPLTEISLE